MRMSYPTFFLLALVAFCSSLLRVTYAWDIDERCLRRRRRRNLLTKYGNGTNSIRGEEQGLPMGLEDTVSLLDQNNMTTSASGNTSSLRGSLERAMNNASDNGNGADSISVGGKQQERLTRDLQTVSQSNTAALLFDRTKVRGSSGGEATDVAPTNWHTFALKLHWTEGACWQEEWREREWCMQCEGSTCNYDDILHIKKCRNIPQQRFQWLSTGGTTGRLKTQTANLCLQKMGFNTFRLRLCDDSIDSQVLIRSNMNEIFEIYPSDNTEKCLNQHHHPKEWEEVITTDCSTARKWSTSNWKIIWPGYADIGDGDGTGDAANGLSLRNPECSRWQPCDQCEGDCDQDSHCRGDLRCFQRNGRAPVPGCSGSGVAGRDYCYMPEEEDNNNDENNGDGDGDGDAANGLSLRNPECSRWQPCDQCEGDCDQDSHCRGDLQCFQRNGRGPVPGCSGNGVSGRDYCYMPEEGGNNNDENNRYRLSIRDHWCRESMPCGMCEGDCNSDRDCRAGLQCVQRNRYERVPGCMGRGRYGRDYCTEL